RLALLALQPVGRGLEVEAEVGEAGQRRDRIAGEAAHRDVRVDEQHGERRAEPGAARGLLRRPPAHVPGRDRALGRVALERPAQRGRDAALPLVELRLRDAVPFGEVAARPLERAVEVAEGAGVRAPGLVRDGGARAVDPVAAHGGEETVGRVRHVAVEAAAPRAPRRVVRVLRPERRDLWVALDAGLVARAVRRELIRGVTVAVHRVAGQTVDLAALEAGRLEQAVVLAPCDADRPVRPEGAADRGRIRGELLL